MNANGTSSMSKPCYSLHRQINVHVYGDFTRKVGNLYTILYADATVVIQPLGEIYNEILVSFIYLFILLRNAHHESLLII